MSMKKTIFKAWKVFVAEMDFCDFTLLFQNRENTYTRFIDHVKANIERALKGKSDYITHLNVSGDPELPENWWEMMVGIYDGKKISPIFEEEDEKDSQNKNHIDDEDLEDPKEFFNSLLDVSKEDAYNSLLPVYTAIKDSYDSRFKLFSWIFDHARYTAERDSMKALCGMLQAITGDSKEEVNRRYKELRTEVKLTRQEKKSLERKVKADKLKLTEPEKKRKLEEEKAKENSRNNSKNMADLANALKEAYDDDSYDYEAEEEIEESKEEIENSNDEREKLSNNPDFLKDVNGDENENDMSQEIDDDELSKSSISISNK